MMIRIQFVKPVYLFESGDEATVPDRVARQLTGTGFAYVRKPEPEVAPAAPVAEPEPVANPPVVEPDTDTEPEADPPVAAPDSQKPQHFGRKK